MRLGAEGWIVARIGRDKDHHFADLPPSFAEYERSLGRTSRQSLRRDHRRLGEHLDGAVHARRFASLKDVPEFVACAQAISRKT